MGMGKEKGIIKILKSELFYKIGIGFLLIIYLLLAYKNPFKQNNLISNLEPFPDTFYYSVPIWNWLHGNGYKMAYEGMEITKDVPPLYGIFLLPFFKIFNDIRSYYYGNVLLGIGTVLVFLKLVNIFYKKSEFKNLISLAIGFVLVTNFYFYNLPTLMMAENIQLPIILITVLLVIDSFTLKNIVSIGLMIGLMLFSKMSNLPIIACVLLFMTIKILQTKFWTRINKYLVFLIFGLLIVFTIWFFWTYLYSNIKVFFIGSWWFSPKFFKNNFFLYINEFIGKNGKYLWYENQQVEMLVGYLSIIGGIFCLLKKEYRERSLIIIVLIVSMIVFHSFLYYPEGRYISVVVPLFIILLGGVFDSIKNVRIIIVAVCLMGYLLMRQNTNGFYERKITSLKRQIINNQLEKNEVPWNYVAIMRFNEIFNKTSDDVYLGSFLPPFNFMFFGNNKYHYLPISYKQEFGEYRGLLTQLYKGELLDYYENLIKDGKSVYVTNYFLKNNPSTWPAEFEKVLKRFNYKEIADGCMGICKIYKLELK